jgi:MFS-type transporter involved in bile tolerance (Atg22 family)
VIISFHHSFCFVSFVVTINFSSTVLVNVALVELASEAAGCETGADEEECTGKVYGLNPVSLISGVPVVAGLLGAFFMPIIGVILDFTSYRRFVGILFSTVFTVIQAVQIAIGERTWFAVSILQAIAGFCFTVIGVTNYAYLPEICDKVGHARHARYTSRYVAKQFSTMTLYMILVSGISFALGIADDSVQTARLSQGLVSVILCILFGVGWRHMPSRHATRELPPGIRGIGMFAYGIRQNVRTIVSIHRVYKKGLRWYLLATMFANATVTAVTSTSVVYLSAEVGMNAVDISMFMLVVLVGTVAGTMVALLVLKHANPILSWQFTMLYICIVLVIGSQTLGDARSKYLSIVWGFFVGVGLGWYYPAENLLFSCILPKGQEAEIAGFRMYCAIILAWFTPLVFGILVQKGVDPKWGMTFIGCFILIPAAMLRFCAGSWEENVEESGRADLAGAGVAPSPFVRSISSAPVSPETGGPTPCRQTDS